jgi:hypothetical protein
MFHPENLLMNNPKMEIMKTSTLQNLLLFSFLILAHLPEGYTQGRQRNWQEHYKQLEARRIAFLTNEIALTPEEAQIFWPVYNEYNQKRNQMMIRHRRQRVEERNFDQLSERELRDLADADLNNMKEMLQLRRDYHEKFLQILPTVKVILLYDAERNFNRRLYQEDRGGRKRD